MTIMKDSKIIAAIQDLAGMGADLDELEALFRKRKGRNPLALDRIRDAITTTIGRLAPLLIEEITRDRALVDRGIDRVFEESVDQVRQRNG